MTDRQIIDTVLKRASKAVKSINEKLVNPKLVLTQQYQKKLYFSIKFENQLISSPIAFSHKGKTMVFILPELPERLIEWKIGVIRRISQSRNGYIPFDLETSPKEIVHIFSSSIISALNTPGMGVHIMAMGLPTLFSPDETYEEVQIEADMMEFENE